MRPKSPADGKDTHEVSLFEEDPESQNTVSITLSTAVANPAPTFPVANGTVTTNLGGNVSAGHSLVIQPDGRIVLAGESDGNGSLDTTFDGDGLLSHHGPIASELSANPRGDNTLPGRA